MDSTPTMRDLAKALEISVATVSMALRNHPRVAAETRRQVQQFARENGYRLNPALASLMSRVRQAERAEYKETIAWLNTWEDEHFFTKNGVEYSRKLWQGASQRAAKLGYVLDSFWLAEPGMTFARIKGILAARGIRGVLIPPLPRTYGHLRIDWHDFSAVALSHTLARPALHRIAPDHHENMQMILRNIRKRGYRRPGLLIPERYDERSEHRLSAAYHQFQAAMPRKLQVPLLTCPEAEFPRPAVLWLKRFRPDVVITVGAYRHLRQLDLGDSAYPNEIGIVLIGRAATDAGFAAINENPAQIGATAVDQLGAMLARNERGLSATPLTVLIKGTWVEGKSLPALAGRRPNTPT